MAEVDTSFYPKADPNALTDTTNKLLTLQSNAQSVGQGHLDLVKNQVNYLVDGFSTLASKKDLSQDDFVNFGQRALQEGIISPDVFKAEMENVAKAGGDQSALRNLATNYGLRALDAGQRFSAQYGTPSTIDNGQSIQPVTVSPLTGIHPMGAGIEKLNSPQDLSAPAVVMGENGPQAGTQGQALTAAGVDPNTGRPANRLVAPAAPSVPDVGAAPAAIQPVAPLHPLPVGEVDAATATGKAAGDALAADRDLASNYQQNVTPIAQAIAHLEALPDNATGPGAEDINTIQSFLQTMGLPVTDAQKIQNFDEFKKYATNLARTNGNTGTNDQLAAAISGSPGTTVSTLANKDILKTLYALARMKNAQVKAFDASGLPQSQYGKWGVEFNATQDPRAYAFDLMPLDARKKLVEGLSAPDKKKFIGSLKTAVSLGLVQPNGQ